MPNTIQIKRGLFASLPTLVAGEFGFSTDTKQVHIGDGAANHEVLMHRKFDANTILAANADNTPLALSISEQRIVGRLTGGNISAITIGIADNNMLQVDGSPNDNEFAKFTAAGLEGRTYAETLADLSNQAGADFAWNSKKLTGLLDPTLAQDAATKAYVDLIAQGIKNKSVADVRAQGNVAALTGLQTIDGVALTDGEQILCDSQTTVTQDGLYIVRSGAWERESSWLVGEEVGGYFIFIKGGTDDGKGFVCTNDDGADVVGTDNLVFVQFSSAGGVMAHKDTHDPNNGSDALDTAAAIEISAVVAAGVGTSHSFSRADHVHAINHGITDNHIVTIDGSANSSEYAKFTANGLEGKTFAEVMADLSGQAGANFSMNTKKITEVVDPTSNQDAATKKYVDDQVNTHDTFLELTDTPAGYGSGYDFVQMNAGGTALVYVSVVDGGAF